jgi:epoxide hydrolase-like predicted phosphatase
MIKAIIFDFFGVICSDEYWESVKNVQGRTDEFLSLADSVSIGKISWREFIKEMSVRTGKSEEELIKGYATQKLNPEVLALIKRLHQLYRIALLSNASAETIRLLTKDVPMDKLFNAVIVSSDVGMIKPDPAIYQIALSRLKVQPHEAIFIDDSSKYALAAKTLGMNVIIYKNFGQMKAELMRLLAPAGSNN